MHFTNSDARRVLRFASLALLTVLPFAAVSFAGDPYQPVRALLSACALAVLALTASGPKSDPIVSRTTRAAFIALAVVLTASLASALVASPASALFGVHGRFQGLLTTVLFALAAFVGARAGIGGAEVRFLGRAAAASLAVQSGLVLVQRISGGDPAGTMGNAVLAAGWLVVVSAFVAGVAIAERGWWRALGLSAAALGMAALGATATRGAWIATFAAGIVALVLVRGSARKLVPIALAVLLAGALLLGGPAVVSKLATADLSTGSAGSRLEIWKATAAMIADHPLLGVGPGRFIYEYPAYQTAGHVRIEGGDTRADQAHGIVLQAAAETGVPGALALLALAGIALTAGVRGARRGDAVSLAGTIALSAFTAQALFGISTVETDTLAWLLGGLVISRGAHVEGRLWPARAAGALALACALVAAAYISADVAYRRSIDEFGSARFNDAMDSAQAAVEGDPLVDVYRVALADAAAYAAVSGDGSAIDRALESVDAGLVLEPASYDLAASRARLLARSPSASATEVWQAYERAFALYPRGVGIRSEAFGWAQTSASEDILAGASAELQRVTSDTNNLDADE